MNSTRRVVLLVLLIGCGGTGDPGTLTDVTAAPDFRPDIAAPDIAAPDIAAPDIAAADVGAADVGAADVGAADVGAADVPAPAGPSICGAGEPAALPTPIPSNVGAPSPWEGADQPNVILGVLDDPTSVVPTSAVWGPDYGVDLSSATFDVYVPPAYDGSEPYGLITFINAGDDGGLPPSDLRPLLDEHKLIWVAPDKVGNAIPSVKRLGWAHVAGLRMLERLNLDRRRLFLMGRSGGARHANLLAFMHPEMWSGVMAWCGAHYFQEVAQEYETQSPDSHYEFWDQNFIPASADFAIDVAASGQRFALMTSDADFREGDLMNIYHFGYLADGLPARLLDTLGGHCVSDPSQMRSGIAYVEHPQHPVIVDAFADGDLTMNADQGDGFVVTRGTATEAAGTLRLEPDSTVVAANRVVWADRFGMTFRTTVRLDGSGIFALKIGNQEAADFTVELTRTDGAARLRVTAPADGQPAIVLEGLFADWTDVNEALGLTVHLWDAELHVVVTRHLDDATQTAGGGRLLRDRRTFIVTAVDWPSPTDATLTLDATGGTADVGPIRLIDGVGLSCAP